MINLLILLVLNMFMIFSLEGGGDNITKSVLVAIIFSVLSTGIFARGKLTFYTLDIKKSSSSLFKSRVLFPGAAYFMFAIGIYGLEMLQFLWMALLVLPLAFDQKNNIAKRIWASKGIFKVFDNVDSPENTPEKTINSESLFVNIIITAPILIFVYSLYFKK